MRTSCLQADKDGIKLFVRLTPNASKDEVLGLEDGADGPLLKAKVRAIPDKGKANRALIALVAKWLRTAKRDIELKAGSKSRCKTLKISGDADELSALINEKLSPLTQPTDPKS